MIELAAHREEGVFEVGDRVYADDKQYHGTGVVIFVGGYIGVRFPEAPEGDRGCLHNCEGRIPDRRGRWYRPKNLQLL